MPANLLAVACGFSCMALIGHADDAAFAKINNSTALATRAAAAGLIEETGKLLSILLLAYTVFRSRVRAPLDGLLLGQLIGLGMGLNESRLYLQLAPPTLQTLGMEIVRLFAHALMAGVIGFGVGCLRSDAASRREARWCLLLCVSLTTAIHFSWNIVAYARQDNVPAHVIPMLLMLTLMLLWKTFCSIAQRHVAPPAWSITTALHRTA